MDEVEIAIIGGGPAGITAGMYAARARRRVVLWEGGVLGGQIAFAGRVENYPGFPNGIDGPDLALSMHEQAEQAGLETRYERVDVLRREGSGFVIESDGHEIRARSVIVAVGAEHRKLGVPGEERLTGRGVSYCATCDAPLFRGQEVAVIGGGDAAVDEALLTARHASDVWLVHRGERLRATKILQERASAEPALHMLPNHVVEEINGEDEVRSVSLRDVASGRRHELPVGAVFVFVGHVPSTSIIDGLVTLDAGGHAPVSAWMETDVPGLYCAGEARSDSARQLVAAAGDGAAAAIAADRYLSEHFAE